MTHMERHFVRLNAARIRQDRREDHRWLAWPLGIAVMATVFALALFPDLSLWADAVHPECPDERC